jgi:L-rhamnose mutarotase
MKSFAQVLDLKNDPKIIEKYEEYHRDVWPEVLAALKKIGIKRMEIFRVGNHLFMYCLVPDDFDPKRNFQGYTELAPRAKEWNDLMSTFQQKVPEAGPDDWWTPGKLVFDTEWF